MKLLIADDDKEFAEILGRLIGAPDVEITGVVTCGGLGVIRAYARERPDAVLMDYLMPRLNGVSVCRHLLSTDPSARIILMSGNADAPSLQWAAHSAGAMAVLRKPFSARAVQELLGGLSGRAADEAAGAMGGDLRAA